MHLSFIDHLRRWKARNPLMLWLFVAQWRRLAARTRPMNTPSDGTQRLLIIACDPWTATGSKGDQAMMAGVVDHFAAGGQALDVRVLVAGAAGVKAVERSGWQALPFWPVHHTDLPDCMLRLRAFAPHQCVTLGADVMDGFYSPSTALRLLGLSDLLARSGVGTTVLGFSFNRQPVSQIARMFDRVTPLLRLNLRDALSLSRFRGVTHARAELVADAAFLMSPRTGTPPVNAVRDFVVAQAAAGRATLAINAHPMLFEGQGDDGGRRVARLQQALTDALGHLLSQRPVSLVLLSHDERPGRGDLPFLRVLHGALAPHWPDRLLLPDAPMDARELKAAAGLVDGVVSGRMHLAIAALGSGVPVAALTYQDKFEGLFDHFGLDHHWLRTGEQALQPGALGPWLIDFFDQRIVLRRQVCQHLPRVIQLAQANLFNGSPT